MPRPERRLAKSCSTRANHRPVCPFSPIGHLTSYWSLGTRKIPSRFADSSTCYVYYHGFVGLFFYLLPSPEKLNFLARIRILYMDGRQRTKATKNGWRQPHDTTQPNKTGELSLVRLQSRVVFSQLVSFPSQYNALMMTSKVEKMRACQANQNRVLSQLSSWIAVLCFASRSRFLRCPA